MLGSDKLFVLDLQKFERERERERIYKVKIKNNETH